MTAAAIAFEQQRPAADVEVDGVHVRGEDDPADAGHRARDHEDEDPDPGDVDAGAARGLGVPADRVDVPAEGRPLRKVGQPHEEDEHEHAGQREPLRNLGVVADGDDAEARDGDAEHLGDGDPRAPDLKARAVFGLRPEPAIVTA